MANRFAFSLNRKENRLIWVAYLQINATLFNDRYNVTLFSMVSPPYTQICLLQTDYLFLLQIFSGVV